MRKIKIGVIGVGKLGQHHARLLSQNLLVELVGVADVDVVRARKIARTRGTQYFQNFRDLLPLVEAVTIAVPTPLHAEIGVEALNQGLHCLIEKPIATSVSEAEALIVAAQKKNVILQVGHVERFNPAVLAALPHIHGPIFIEVERLGPYDPRVSHIGVVLDLMIHDLDILLSLVGSEIEDLDAIGASVLSFHEDIVKARLRFSSGCTADLTASRMSLERFRRIRVFQKNSYLSIDCLKPGLKVAVKKSSEVRTLEDVKIFYPRLKYEEPLKSELEHFISCLHNGTPPLVTGEHGRDALVLGLEILKRLERHELKGAPHPRVRKNLLVVAGDPSGDLHAAHLISQLKKLDSSLEITAVGGPKTREVADHFLFDLASLGVAGFWEPLTRTFLFRRLLRQIREYMNQKNPSAFIPVDFYGFNYQVLGLAAHRNISSFYFVSPQVWASRPGRIRKLAQLVKHMLVILPFEESLYRRSGVPSTFVGHPLLDLVPEVRKNGYQEMRERGQQSLRLGLLPGSRPEVARRHLPIFSEALRLLAKKVSPEDIEVFLFAAPAISNHFVHQWMGDSPLRVHLVREEDYEIRKTLDFAWTASGTATLENALLGVPMVVVYQLSWLTYFIAKMLIHVPHISLVNILSEKSLVPELIQHRFTPSRLVEETFQLGFPDLGRLKGLSKQLLSLRDKLGNEGAFEKTARFILERI